MGITTYGPTNLEVTNKWEYSDFISIQPMNRNQPNSNEFFSITMRKDRKVDTMKFSSEYRSHILTEALKYRNQFAEKPKETYVIIIISITFQVVITKYKLLFFFFKEISSLQASLVGHEIASGSGGDALQFGPVGSSDKHDFGELLLQGFRGFSNNEGLSKWLCDSLRWFWATTSVCLESNGRDQEAHT